MKAIVKNKLARLGFSLQEIEALDALLDMQKEVILTQDNDERAKKINLLIREKYSLTNEIAIIRQKEEKPDEFIEYSNYVEECKANVDKK